MFRDSCERVKWAIEQMSCSAGIMLERWRVSRKQEDERCSWRRRGCLKKRLLKEEAVVVEDKVLGEVLVKKRGGAKQVMKLKVS